MINYLIDLFFVGFPFWFKYKELKLQKINWKAVVKICNAIGLKKIKSTELIKKTLILIGALFLTLFIIGIAINLLNLNDDELVVETIKAIAHRNVVMLAYLLTIRVVAEEIFFRGLLLDKFGNFFQASLFAIMHLSYGSYAEVIAAFFLGLVLGKYYIKNKNLFPNILAHVLFNVVILTATGIL